MILITWITILQDILVNEEEDVQKHIYTVCYIFSDRNQNVKIYTHIIYYVYMFAKRENIKDKPQTNEYGDL